MERTLHRNEAINTSRERERESVCVCVCVCCVTNGSGEFGVRGYTRDVRATFVLLPPPNSMWLKWTWSGSISSVQRAARHVPNCSHRRIRAVAE